MVNLNDTTPAAPSSHVNVQWQQTGNDVSAYVPTGAGGVTSVAMTVPTGFTIGGSPVTTTGTLAVGLSTQTANTVWAGPTTGSAATPAFRALVAADIPAQPYDLVCSLVGKPGAGATVLIFTVVRAVTFPANFGGSYGSVGVANTSTAVYTVLNGVTTIGTVTLTVGGSPATVTFTFATTGGTSKSLAAGDRLTITAPGSQDATLSDVGMTFAGTR